jgi:sensor histidine kinase YesM
MSIVRNQLQAWKEEIKALPDEVTKSLAALAGGVSALPNIITALIYKLFVTLVVLLGLLVCIWMMYSIFTAEHTPLWHIWHFLYH